MSGSPPVDVLLLTYNGWAHAVECMESLLRLRYPNFRIVVCDNASPDGTPERIREWAEGRREAPIPKDTRLRRLVQPPVEKPLPVVELDCATAERGGGGSDRGARIVLVQTGRNGGFAAGNNVGLRYALAHGGARYVWLLNPDTVVDPDALTALVAAAEADPRAAMVGGKLLHYYQPDRVQAAAGGRVVRWSGRVRLVGDGLPDGPRWDLPGPLDYVHGACLLARVEALRTVGLMDESFFMYYEETEWCLRAQQMGWRLGYAPRCRVWHKEGGGAGRRGPVQEYHGLRSQLLFVRKRTPAVFPLAVAHSVYRSVLPKVIRRQPERLRSVLRVYRDLFVPAWLRRKG